MAGRIYLYATERDNGTLGRLLSMGGLERAIERRGRKKNRGEN
jgi:hypothetical protein